LSVSIGLSSIFFGEILAEHPHQDDRRDVGDHHRDQAAGRSHADIELQQCLVVDQVREVCGCVAGTTAGGGEDLGEYRKQENGLDHHHHGDGPGQVG